VGEREDPHFGRQLHVQHRVGEAIDAALSDAEAFLNPGGERPDVRLGGNSRQRLFHSLGEADSDVEVLPRIDADGVPILSVGFVVEDERFHLRPSVARTSSRTVSHGTPLDSPRNARSARRVISSAHAFSS